MFSLGCLLGAIRSNLFCSITSYGDRPNTFADVSEYFRAHFIQVHRRHDIGRRALYAVRSYSCVNQLDVLTKFFLAFYVYARV